MENGDEKPNFAQHGAKLHLGILLDVYSIMGILSEFRMRKSVNPALGNFEGATLNVFLHELNLPLCHKGVIVFCRFA
jgi:hypothetical protein